MDSNREFFWNPFDAQAETGGIGWSGNIQIGRTRFAVFGQWTGS
jgi:hypothetical protein